MIVYWKDMKTGQIGHGSPISDSLAEATVEVMNKKYPHIEHCAEPAEE